MLKFASIAGTKLREMTRGGMSDLGAPLVFPIIFTLVFGFAFIGMEGPFGGGPFFDYLAPGMVVFALLLLTVGVSGSVSREVEKGTLSRLKLSQMSSFDLLFGVLLVGLLRRFGRQTATPWRFRKASMKSQTLASNRYTLHVLRHPPSTDERAGEAHEVARAPEGWE